MILGSIEDELSKITPELECARGGQMFLWDRLAFSDGGAIRGHVTRAG